VRYSFNIYDIHGRLLYPALAPIGVMLALGLSGWPKPKWVMRSALTILLAITVVAPFVIIQPSYARPIVSALPADAIKPAAKFGAVELLGYQLKTERVKAGQPIEVVTYWRKDTADAASPMGVIALIAPDGQILGRAENLLGTAAYPGAVWRAGEIVATRFSVPTQTARPAVATLRLSVADQSADMGQVAVWADRACETDRVVDVSFGGAIKLIGYRIEEGPSPRIVLCWRAIKPTALDYTVFVHVPVAGGQITADAPPLNGNYPTSAWQSGDVIEDAHLLPANNDVKIPRASIGMYRLDTGERLPIDNSGATEFELIK
jgi:hypothetical protein